MFLEVFYLSEMLLYEIKYLCNKAKNVKYNLY